MPASLPCPPWQGQRNLEALPRRSAEPREVDVPSVKVPSVKDAEETTRVSSEDESSAAGSKPNTKDTWKESMTLSGDESVSKATVTAKEDEDERPTAEEEIDSLLLGAWGSISSGATSPCKPVADEARGLPSTTARGSVHMLPEQRQRRKDENATEDFGGSDLYAFMAARFAELECRLAHHDAMFEDLLSKLHDTRQGQAAVGSFAVDGAPSSLSLRLDDVEKRGTACQRQLQLLEVSLGSRVVELERRGVEVTEDLRQSEAARAALVDFADSIAEGVAASSSSSAVVAKVSKETAALGQRLHFLEDYLAEAAVLDRDVYRQRSERQRFRELCVSTHFVPSATLSTIFHEDVVLEKVSAFAGSRESAGALLQVSSDFGRCERLVHALALERLEATFARASRTGATFPELEQAMRLASKLGAHRLVRAGQALMQSAARQRLQAVTLKYNATPKELLEAVQHARQAALPEEEVLLVEERLDEHKAGAARKLKAALSWLSHRNTGSLETAIAEADRCCVSPREVEKARNALSDVLRQQEQIAAQGDFEDVLASMRSPSDLQQFLQAARPKWSSTERSAARFKLSRISVFTKTELAFALQATGDASLNQRLKDAGLPPFKSETLDAFKDELKRSQS